MSGHLIGCAGDLKVIPGQVDDDGRPVPIPKSHKLALLAFADSADNITHIGFAGYAGVQKWAVCSRGRAAELIRDLVEWRLLKPHKRGYRGQRAEYVVFPDGCCDLHRKPVDEPGQPDVEQLAAAAGVSVDQARMMLAAIAGGAPPAPVVPEADPDGHPQEKGSGAPDAVSGTESGAPDPISPVVHGAPAGPVDNPGMGPERVHGSGVNADAFTPSNQNPPTPASGGAGCARHPDPAQPGTNCRGCGTTNRQLAARRRADQAAARRAAEQAAIAAERAKPRGRKPGTEGARAAARAGIAAARTTATTGATR